MIGAGLGHHRRELYCILVNGWAAGTILHTKFNCVGREMIDDGIL